MTSDKVYYTTAELAQEATRRGRPVSRRYIAKLCENESIPAFKVGKGPRSTWLVRVTMAENWLQEWLKGT